MACESFSVVYTLALMRLLIVLFYIFFFKQKTAYEMRISDWSSDVCSSDLRLRTRRPAMRTPLRFLLGIPGIVIGGLTVDPAGAQQVSQDASRRAAIHPVADPAAMQAWLSRVPLTRDFPPDFSATLKGDAPAFVVEMTTSPPCAPCADLA